MKTGKLRAALVVLGLALAVLLVWPERPAGPVGGWMRAAGLTPRFETLDGVRVRYVRAGSGPAVLLLHGFASSIVTWRDVMPALAQGHDVVAVDLPGFGGSDQPGDLSARLYPRLVPALLDRLGIAKASLVGNSMGGAAAVLTAAEHADHVERLVLLDSAGFNMAPGDRPFMVRLAGSPASALLGRLPLHRLLVRQALRQVFFDDSHVTPELVEEYAAPMMREGALGATRSLLSTPGFDTPEEFQAHAAAIKAPTLVVWGREDAWIPVSHADRLVAAIPGARKLILESCGHMPQEERPAEVARLLKEFLGE